MGCFIINDNYFWIDLKSRLTKRMLFEVRMKSFHSVCELFVDRVATSCIATKIGLHVKLNL